MKLFSLFRRLRKMTCFTASAPSPSFSPPLNRGCLEFEILAECPVTKARCGRMTLPHSVVDTPVFMPVGTQGTLKGLTPEQLYDLDCHILLGNTYHLGHRPGYELIGEAGGLHKFMNWDRAILTDSGGFQMVSLAKLMEVKEEGVQFLSPHTGEETLLTPEHCIEIQNVLGADIIMQLDDVVHSLTTGERVEEAMHRTIRWLDRCIRAHKRQDSQNLFPIVQGALNPELRKKCLAEIIKRDSPGYAIGGLSGGEEKAVFCEIVDLCTDHLPRNKPRYLMGVGWAVDLVVCCALGVDMFDCVFPTRTARFGTALTATGLLSLSKKEFSQDFSSIEADCPCSTCKNHSRAYLHSIINQEAVACHLVTVHNLSYQMRLLNSIRESIRQKRFPDFVKEFIALQFQDSTVPQWAADALKAANIEIG